MTAREEKDDEAVLFKGSLARAQRKPTTCQDLELAELRVFTETNIAQVNNFVSREILAYIKRFGVFTKLYREQHCLDIEQVVNYTISLYRLLLRTLFAMDISK